MNALRATVGDLPGAIHAAEMLGVRGAAAESRRRLVALAPDAAADPAAGEALARALYHAGAFAEAAALIWELGAQDVGALSVLAASLVALGDLDGAAGVLDRLIHRHPGDGSAWYNRATLRRWTADDNHVDALREALRTADPEAEIAIRHGLAKELADIGDYAESFAHLRLGAAQRRARLSYRVETDVEAMALIAQAFDRRRLRAAPAPRSDIAGPVFVIGLPRAGATLVDRILSSHSLVASLGEIPDFAMALMETLPRGQDRTSLIRASASADPAPLAARYRERLAGHGADTPLVIDRTSVNFLYVGLIAMALPEARIVHVRRDATDVGYSLFKTLFPGGSPYAYDLDDLGRYIGAYRKLIDHWRAALPGRMIEVDYETLVDDLPGEARRLVAACGLDWEDACQDFHLNVKPCASVGAADVRRPLYRDAMGRWRAFEVELNPLRVILAAGAAL